MEYTILVGKELYEKLKHIFPTVPCEPPDERPLVCTGGLWEAVKDIPPIPPYQAKKGSGKKKH